MGIITYVAPVHYPITLAGNFGEPRPGHFHAGIDIKTQQVEGKAVYAVAEGYVSSTSVGMYGFGNAVTVTHPDGRSTTYCHLKGFSGRIRAAVKRWQYQHHSYVCDAKFQPHEIPVSRGQFIAFSGNTGASQGPHIHLEMKEVATGHLLDPLEELKDYLKDTTPPEVLAFRVFPVPGEGVFAGRSDNQNISVTPNTYRAWGKIGLGVRAVDHMDGVYNNYGVRYTRLFVNGKNIFVSNVSGIPISDHKMVNSWGDYEFFRRNKLWYMKSFVEPGDTLPILTTDASRGIINIDQERDYHIRYELSDIFGNTTVKEFTIRGERHAIPPKPTLTGTVVRWNKDNVIRLPGMILEIPKGRVPYDMVYEPHASEDAAAFSQVYSFQGASWLLFDYVPIHIRQTRPVADVGKLYVSHKVQGPMNRMIPMFCGKDYKNGWVTAKVRDMDVKYFLAYDDEKPVITIGSTSPGRLSFSAFDWKSDVSRVETFVDGKFVLFERMKNRKDYVCHLTDTPIKSTGGERELKIVVTDHCDNQAIATAKIKF